MTDMYTEDTVEAYESDENDIKGLRQAANRAKKLERELAQMQRELAFHKAGIPLSDPKMNYFIKGYEGELEADAIRAAAIESGFLQVQQEVEEVDPMIEQSAAAQERVMRASAGAMPEDVTEGAALARLEAAMSEGGVEAMLEVARQYGIPTTYDAQ
jgi:hypothetical protein